MLFDQLINRGTLPALEKMLAFTEARHRVITENVANADTPGYAAKQLDAKAFQHALRAAIDEAKETGRTDLRLRESREFRQDAKGRLIVTPSTEPPENVLFHDGTNMRLERQMAMLAENAMMHQAATELLRSKFDGLLKAIRGTVR